jgi:tetratricopeptide (TPR) repeat protein
MKARIQFLLSVLLLLSLNRIAISQDSASGTFNKGVTYFNAGNYQEALDLWSGLYESGSRSASLNYNIGNAYFKLNNIPESILFYERAYLLDPADEDINYNLQIARTLIVDRFQEIPELFFVKWYNFVSLFLSANAWARISMISFILTLLAVSLYLYSSRYNFKVIGFWMALVFLMVSLSSMAFSYRNRSMVYQSKMAIISIPMVSGKSSPDNNGTDLFVLHDGTKVSVEDVVGDWYEVRLSDGNKGWVPVNSLIKF